MTTYHYANLSNGLECPHLKHIPYSLVRIQSTWCEQKRWEDILMTLSPDIFFRLAQGDRCIIHDVSEKPRITRAVWQGLPWIRFACRKAWKLPSEKEFTRGHEVSNYFESQWRELSERCRTYLKYFRKYLGNNSSVNIKGCGQYNQTPLW